MSIPALTVRPILHTGHTADWVRLLAALDAETVSSIPEWTEVELGLGGRLALHSCIACELYPDSREGGVDLGFETDDLDAFASAVTPTSGMTVELVDAPHGRAVRVVGRDGLAFHVDERLAGPAPARRTSWVKQLWVSTDVAAAAADLEALGLRTRWATTNGRGVELVAAEGGVLVHIADAGTIGAIFELDVVDLGAAHRALLDAGFAHDVIDETNGRTLKVTMPGWDSPLWVVQEDDDPVGVVRP
jgi:hypothetical protein